jgi:hypothetical protein
MSKLSQQLPAKYIRIRDISPSGPSSIASSFRTSPKQEKHVTVSEGTKSDDKIIINYAGNLMLISDLAKSISPSSEKADEAEQWTIP